MSFDATARVMERELSPPSKKLALVALAHKMNSKTGRINPSVWTVARYVGVTRPRAKALLDELKRDGFITVSNNRGGAHPGNNGADYVLHFDRIEELPIITDGPKPTGTASDTGTAGNAGTASDTGTAGNADPYCRQATPVLPAGSTRIASSTQTRKEQGKKGEQGARALSFAVQQGADSRADYYTQGIPT